LARWVMRALAVPVPLGRPPLDVRHGQGGDVVQSDAGPGGRVLEGLRPVQADQTGLLIDVRDAGLEALAVEQPNVHGDPGCWAKRRSSLQLPMREPVSFLVFLCFRSNRRGRRQRLVRNWHLPIGAYVRASCV
jgi:hypothetical protein